MTDEAVEKRSAYNRQYYLKNRERILKRQKDWRIANPERRRAYDKKWSENNRSKKYAANRRYLKTDKGRAAQRRSKQNSMRKLGQSVGASRLVHCFSCRSIYALEDAVHRGWKLIGKHGCVCDLCQ